MKQKILEQYNIESNFMVLQHTRLYGTLLKAVLHWVLMSLPGCSSYPSGLSMMMMMTLTMIMCMCHHDYYFYYCFYHSHSCKPLFTTHLKIWQLNSTLSTSALIFQSDLAYIVGGFHICASIEKQLHDINVASHTCTKKNSATSLFECWQKVNEKIGDLMILMNQYDTQHLAVMWHYSTAHQIKWTSRDVPLTTWQNRINISLNKNTHSCSSYSTMYFVYLSARYTTRHPKT
jgi:hypothetical protein